MSEASEKFLVNNLTLVYPPISNQEGDWLQNEPDVRAEVSRSKLYMIASRPELEFLELPTSTPGRALAFSLGLKGADQRVAWRIDLDALLGDFMGKVEIEMGEKLIRIWELVDDEPSEVLQWFTPDKLLHAASQGCPGLNPPVMPPEFTTFDLLYVGISKATDSFTRLFESGHQARLKILSNERQRHPTARVTDEMMLFLFDIVPFGIRMSSFAAPLDDYGIDFRPQDAVVIADAEKAFIRLLDPFYNVEKYAQYPRGRDGLYDKGFRRYFYSIAENLTFRTARTVFHRAVQEAGRDIILVEGDAVTVHARDSSAESA